MSWTRLCKRIKQGLYKEVEDGATLEMPRSSFDSRYRSTNDDNDSSLGVEGGGRSIPLHQLDLQIVWQVNISRRMRWRTTQCYLATTKKSMAEVIGNKRLVHQLHAEGGSTPQFFFRAARAISYTIGWGLCEWMAWMWSSHDHTPFIHNALVS